MKFQPQTLERAFQSEKNSSFKVKLSEAIQRAVCSVKVKLVEEFSNQGQHSKEEVRQYCAKLSEELSRKTLRQIVQEYPTCNPLSQGTLDFALKEEDQQRTGKSTEGNTEDAAESEILMSGGEEEQRNSKPQ